MYNIFTPKNSEIVNLIMNSFLSSAPLPFFPFLWVVCKQKRLHFTRDNFTLVSGWWFIKKTMASPVYNSISFVVVISFPPWHSDSATEMTELCRLELARITTAKNENKVSHHKDTEENWSPVTGYSFCLCPTSKMCTFTRQCNQAQTAAVVILLFYINTQN